MVKQDTGTRVSQDNGTTTSCTNTEPTAFLGSFAVTQSL